MSSSSAWPVRIPYIRLWRRLSRDSYGYTSDAKGIRHALLDGEENVTFEEAKFMLVACSAFINYVRGMLKA